MALAFKFSYNENYLMSNVRECRATRSNDPERRQLIVFTPKKQVCERSFSYKLRRDWNLLPTHLHRCSSRKELLNLLALQPPNSD